MVEVMQEGLELEVLLENKVQVVPRGPRVSKDPQDPREWPGDLEKEDQWGMWVPQVTQVSRDPLEREVCRDPVES